MGHKPRPGRARRASTSHVGLFAAAVRNEISSFVNTTQTQACLVITHSTVYYINYFKQMTLRTTIFLVGFRQIPVML